MFELRVADNFEGVDEDSIYTHGRYKTWDEAVQAAKDLVDCSLVNDQRSTINDQRSINIYASNRLSLQTHLQRFVYFVYTT